VVFVLLARTVYYPTIVSGWTEVVLVFITFDFKNYVHNFSPKTLSENIYVSREGCYLSEYLFEIGKTISPPPHQSAQNLLKQDFFLQMHINNFT
jgi:hypothetical protein